MPRWRRLVVVRRDDEEAVDAERVRALGQVDRVARVVRARAGDDRGAAADLVHGRSYRGEALVVGERRRLAGRAGDDEPVGAVLDEVAGERAEGVEVDGAVRPERRDDRGQDLAEHDGSLYAGAATPTVAATWTVETREARNDPDAAGVQGFVLRGNIVELAIAFVMGVAFAAVVNSLVDNLVMPVIAMIIGKPDFRGLTFTINDAVFRYGAFITDVIQFVAIAARCVLRRRQADRGNDRPASGPVEEGMPDEERRHQELLAALQASR